MRGVGEMTTWKVDAAHTDVSFQVRHMMVSKVRGRFDKVSGTIEGDPTDLANTIITFDIKVDSINTANEDRDNHLRSADFFDVEHYPDMTFTSTNIVAKGDGAYDITGKLTIKDTTKNITFKAGFEGKAVDPWGNDVVGFSARGKVDRKEFGLTWNQALETGGFLVGDDIKISIDLEANPA